MNDMHSPAAAHPGTGNPVPPPGPDTALRDHPATHTLSSDQLMRGRTSLAIAHNGAIYRLQTTRQGKLILTK